MRHVQFKGIAIGQRFFCNGNWCIKRSTRTAMLEGYNKVFYFGRLEAVQVAEMDKIGCTCGNPESGFDCICSWVLLHPGVIDYSCEYCGLYTASTPLCTKCESV